MQILSVNFLIFTISGMWRPVEWSSNCAKLLYNVLTYVILISEYFLVTTQFMDVILVVDNIDDFSINILMCLTIIAVCCKATVIVVRRNAVIDLVQMLLKEPCKFQNEDEIAIQTKFDQFISVTIGSVLDTMQGHLPYRVWLPFDTNTSLIFWIISIQQIVTVAIAGLINAGMETLVFGLFLQTCAQLEIFENRLHKLVINTTASYLKHVPASLNKYKTMLSECIYHHLTIYKYAKMVNNIFNQVFFVQFFSSILVLCTSVYYLAAHVMETKAATLLVYTIGMFVQIYFLCWSGNEVMLMSMKTGHAIYHTNWPLLSVREKKDLLMIMMRSTRPIKFTSSFLITLSLESYSNILKTSYSAFNVLQQS
ncbi:odorant receptor 46a-like isoform X2 [Linepithema humile]|uniref:odorant receptor 46a-like isoform X2 n=1 Tax=Linepithema humile TaxID=83485 RepID=UPI00351F6D6A